MSHQRVSLKAMRQMILASDKTDRQAALDKLLAMQREDITELFRSLFPFRAYVGAVFCDFIFPEPLLQPVCCKASCPGSWTACP